jgi:hypothetical protein
MLIQPAEIGKAGTKMNPFFQGLPGSMNGGRYQSPFSMQCCTANGNQAFYYAWEAVVDHPIRWY